MTSPLELEDIQFDNANHECILNGYLSKQSLHIKKFRKRWMSLRAHYLFSYKDILDEFQMKEPTEKIDLTEYKYINAKDLKFELITSDKKNKRVFIASSIEERNK